jgi:hypothetical protein
MVTAFEEPFVAAMQKVASSCSQTGRTTSSFFRISSLVAFCSSPVFLLVPKFLSGCV